MSVPHSLHADAETLSTSTGYVVDLEPEGGQICIIVRAAALPPGAYTRTTSDVLLLTDFQYPMSSMDMFYMEPDVQHANGPIPSHATTIEQHASRSWRRWSWHRNGIWKPGVDSLLSHWAFVEACWAKETPG